VAEEVAAGTVERLLLRIHRSFASSQPGSLQGTMATLSSTVQAARSVCSKGDARRLSSQSSSRRA
jgi:hypothetical protein